MTRKEYIKKKSEKVKFTGNLFQILNRTFEIYKENYRGQFTVEVARRPPGVRLIIVNNENILLTKEFRSELEGWDYRLAGGKIFNSLSEYLKYADYEKIILEKAEEAAFSEGLEEAGVSIHNPQLFYKSTSGSTIEWDLYYYLVTDFEILVDGNQAESSEIINPEWIPFKEAMVMCFDGRIKEDRSIGILLKYLLSCQKTEKNQ